MDIYIIPKLTSSMKVNNFWDKLEDIHLSSSAFVIIWGWSTIVQCMGTMHTFNKFEYFIIWMMNKQIHSNAYSSQFCFIQNVHWFCSFFVVANIFNHSVHIEWIVFYFSLTECLSFLHFARSQLQLSGWRNWWIVYSACTRSSMAKQWSRYCEILSRS